MTQDENECLGEQRLVVAKVKEVVSDEGSERRKGAADWFVILHDKTEVATTGQKS